jgi:DNA polymerase III sliding clamp (beta) subunit (PCNA family)
MLDSLKFVMGAVSTKDFHPELTHFRIQGGHVRGYNGTIALSSPLPLDITCNPKAEPLVKAIQSCYSDEAVTVSLLNSGRLSIKSGKFKALIPCLESSSFDTFPEGEYYTIDGERFLKALKMIYPFIGSDASRPWAMGTLLLNESIFATNNILLIEYWLGYQFPVCCCIPRLAVSELLRIKENPVAIQVGATSITFHYENDRWLRTQLFDAKTWPDLTKVLKAESAPQPIDKEVFEAIRTVKPFIDKVGLVYLTDGLMHTHMDMEQGAQYQIPTVVDSAYNAEMLLTIEGVAQEIDWSTYPKPCLFFGDRLRGAIIGALRHAS